MGVHLTGGGGGGAHRFGGGGRGGTDIGFVGVGASLGIQKEFRWFNVLRLFVVVVFQFRPFDHGRWASF